VRPPERRARIRADFAEPSSASEDARARGRIFIRAPAENGTPGIFRPSPADARVRTGALNGSCEKHSESVARSPVLARLLVPRFTLLSLSFPLPATPVLFNIVTERRTAGAAGSLGTLICIRDLFMTGRAFPFFFLFLLPFSFSSSLCLFFSERASRPAED